MKKLIAVSLMVFMLSGCSLVKTLVAPFKPTVTSVPQQTEKSKVKNVCKGKAKFNAQGDMIYCSSGYYIYEENFGQKERRMTIKEKIIQFVDKFWGYALFIGIGLVFLCPQVLSFLFGRFIEGATGIAKKSLNATVRAIQKVRKNGIDLNQALSSEQDSNVKSYIAKIKEKENIK